MDSMSRDNITTLAYYGYCSLDHVSDIDVTQAGQQVLAVSFRVSLNFNITVTSCLTTRQV